MYDTLVTLAILYTLMGALYLIIRSVQFAIDVARDVLEMPAEEYPLLTRREYRDFTRTFQSK